MKYNVMVEKASLDLLYLLISRLEHLSVDSRWARRASGLRGNILKVLDDVEIAEVAQERLDLLIDRSFEILSLAAREIPDIEDLLQEQCRNQ